MAFVSLFFGCLRSEARGPQGRPVRKYLADLGEDVALLLVGAGDRHGDRWRGGWQG